MAGVVQWFQQAYKRRFIRFGAPFLILIVGGSFGLERFASIRYDYRTGKKITDEEAEKYGIKKKKKEFSLDTAYEELQEKDLDQWQNIRGPRPWEDSKTIQDSQREQNKR